MLKENRIAASRKTLLIAVSLTSWLAVSPAMASSLSGGSGASSGNCPPTQSDIQQAANGVYKQAKGLYQNLVPQPQNLSSSTCFSNIFNMGTSIGLSFFNPADLIKQLEQMVCNAAQQALRWPMQQADNAINQYGQLPYGMGGVSAEPSATPGVSVSTFTSSGPSVGNIPTGNGNGSTLANALGG